MRRRTGRTITVLAVMAASFTIIHLRLSAAGEPDPPMWVPESWAKR